MLSLQSLKYLTFLQNFYNTTDIRKALPKKTRENVGILKKQGVGGVYPNPTSIFYCFYMGDPQTINVPKGTYPLKKTVKKGDIVRTGGRGVNPSSFFKPNLPDSQITQKWTFDTTI